MTSERPTDDEIINTLLFEAQFEYGDNGIWTEGKDLSWLDINLIRVGQAFFQKHYTSLMFAHALYFGLGFGFKPVTALVIKTQSFHGEKQTPKRILSTIWNVLRWYEHDLTDMHAEGYRAVSRIRRTHQSIRNRSEFGGRLDFEIPEEPIWAGDHLGQALNGDLSCLNTSIFQNMALTYDPPETISQFSLSIIQISFLLPVLAHPGAFGINDMEGAEGFEHLWALIGRSLGIEDRYNIPLLRPGRTFYRNFWEKVWLPSFLVRDSKIGGIQDSYYKSLDQFLPQMSVAGNVYYYLNQSGLRGFTGSEIYKLLTTFDKAYIVVLRLIFRLMQTFPVVRTGLNSIVRFSVRKILGRYKPEVKIHIAKNPFKNPLANY